MSSSSSISSGLTERRVEQRLAVELQLAIGLVQVGVNPLVLPDEVVAKEDVGEPLLAVGLDRAGLEGEGLALRVVAGGVLGRRGVADEAADVIEVTGVEGGFLLL